MVQRAYKRICKERTAHHVDGIEFSSLIFKGKAELKRIQVCDEGGMLWTRKRGEVGY